MRFKTLIFGYALVLAIFVFAKRQPDASAAPTEFREVVDLTVADSSTKSARADSPRGSLIEAPARVSSTLWTADQIPADRLVAPLVVIDAAQKKDSRSQAAISTADIAEWEQAHGQIPANSVVVARTGFARAKDSHYRGFSDDAARFLVEGRAILGLGTDAPSVDAQNMRALPVHNFTLAHSVYDLENVGNLEAVPPTGSVIVVASAKLSGASVAPARLLAMVR